MSYLLAGLKGGGGYSISLDTTGRWNGVNEAVDCSIDGNRDRQTERKTDGEKDRQREADTDIHNTTPQPYPVQSKPNPQPTTTNQRQTS
jgi:hypothetical protein